MSADEASEGPDLPWRTELADRVRHGSTTEATDALLSLTYHEKDQRWLESFILTCLDPAVDPQVRALAITCLGHVGRLFGSVKNQSVVAALTELLEDEDLGGQAEDALDDIRHFTASSSD